MWICFYFLLKSDYNRFKNDLLLLITTLLSLLRNHGCGLEHSKGLQGKTYQSTIPDSRPVVSRLEIKLYFIQEDDEQIEQYLHPLEVLLGIIVGIEVLVSLDPDQIW